MAAAEQPESSRHGNHNLMAGRRRKPAASFHEASSVVSRRARKMILGAASAPSASSREMLVLKVLADAGVIIIVPAGQAFEEYLVRRAMIMNRRAMPESRQPPPRQSTHSYVVVGRSASPPLPLRKDDGRWPSHLIVVNTHFNGQPDAPEAGSTFMKRTITTFISSLSSGC